jgi:hypothetical protein
MKIVEIELRGKIGFVMRANAVRPYGGNEVLQMHAPRRTPHQVWHRFVFCNAENLRDADERHPVKALETSTGCFYTFGTGFNLEGKVARANAKLCEGRMRGRGRLPLGDVPLISQPDRNVIHYDRSDSFPSGEALSGPLSHFRE